MEFGAEQGGNTKEAVPRKESEYSRKKEKTAAMDDLRAREARSWALLVQRGMAVGSWGLGRSGVAAEQMLSWWVQWSQG